MFVSTVPDRTFSQRLSKGGSDKEEYKGNMEEAGRGPSEIFSAEVQKPGDGVKIYHEEDGRQIPTGEDRSLFTWWLGGGGKVTYGDVSGRQVDVNVEGSAVPSSQGTIL